MFFGTPFLGSVNNALKTAIIARAKSAWSRNMLHFCLNDNTSSNDSSQNASLADSRMVIDSGGFVGIGTTTPNYPLDVNTWTSPSITGGYYFSNGTGTTPFGTSQQDVSIRAVRGIMTNSNFYASSDTRIKKEIVDVVDASALETIRLIEPKQYKYIDNVNRSKEPVWGFIAQQVKSVLNYSVSLQTQFIPNIYERAFVIANTGGSILEIVNENTSKLSNTNTSGGFSIVLQAFVDDNDTQRILRVKEILNEKQILVEEILEENDLFLFGQEVDDFHILNKDAIFSMSVAALQEVDRQLQTAKERIDILEAFIQSKFPGEM